MMREFSPNAVLMRLAAAVGECVLLEANGLVHVPEGSLELHKSTKPEVRWPHAPVALVDVIV
jgi:hypothetical protein